MGDSSRYSCRRHFLNLADKLTPHLHHITGVDHETHADRQSNLNKVMLFVMAIAIHNLPEGIAAVLDLEVKISAMQLQLRWVLLYKTFRKEW